MSRQIGKMMNPNQGQVPAAVTADANKTALDCSGYEEVVYVLDVGAVSGTSPTLDVKIQEADASNGTFADITGAAFTQVTAANQIEVISTRVNSAKPFQRVVIDVGGTSPNFTMAVAQIRCKPGLLPADSLTGDS